MRARLQTNILRLFALALVLGQGATGFAQGQSREWQVKPGPKATVWVSSSPADDFFQPSTTPCQPQVSNLLELSMYSGDERIRLMHQEDCQAFVGQRSLRFQEGSTFGTLRRHGEGYTLTEGVIQVAAVSKVPPLQYKVTFTLRFANKSNHERFLNGETLSPEDTIEVSGEATFSPHIKCVSLPDSQTYDSVTDARLPDHPSACFEALGLPQPTRVPVRQGRFP